MGATNASIVNLVVMESTVLMLVSGSLGLMLAVGLLETVAPMANHSTFKTPGWITGSHCSRLGFGDCWTGKWIGTCVARSGIRPVEALRDE